MSRMAHVVIEIQEGCVLRLQLRFAGQGFKLVISHFALNVKVCLDHVLPTLAAFNVMRNDT